jgi:hypothetical protein
MADNSKLVYLAAGVLVVTAIFIFFMCNCSKEGYSSFVTGGAMDNLGANAQGCVMYDMVNGGDGPSLADSSQFATMVREGYEPSPVSQASLMGGAASGSASARYDDLLQSSGMPKIDAGVTQFNVDVANPQLYQYTVVPSILLSGGLRSEYANYDLATQIRGDIPIKMFDIPLIGATTASTGERQRGYFDQAPTTVQADASYRNIPAGSSGAAQFGLGGVIMDNTVAGVGSAIAQYL